MSRGARSQRTALLSEEGKTLDLQVLAPAGANLDIYSTEPRAEYDAPNPGTRMIGFTTTLEPEQRTRLVGRLVPGGRCGRSVREIVPIENW